MSTLKTKQKYFQGPLEKLHQPVKFYRGNTARKTDEKYGNIGCGVSSGSQKFPIFFYQQIKGKSHKN